MIAVNQFPRFKANKNGTNQTGMSSGAMTQVTLGTEVYDIGSFFATNAWTPPAGKISLTACLGLVGNVTNGTWQGVAIYKDGALFVQTYTYGIASNTGVVVSTDDIATGSNVYTMYGYITGGTGRAFSGDTTATYFSGHWFSP